jgi:hypothetical protein
MMTIYSKKLTSEWNLAFEQYERFSGFKPMHQESIDAGEMTAREAWTSNICWLEDMVADVTNITTPSE